jgi:hypothetical protein
MARKLALSRLEGDIMAQLSEAGCEDLPTLLNSLSQDGVHYPTGELVLDEFQRALARLIDFGLAEFVYSIRPGYPKVEAQRARALRDLRTWLRWEPKGGYWTAVSDDSDDMIGLAQK